MNNRDLDKTEDNYIDFNNGMCIQIDDIDNWKEEYDRASNKLESIMDDYEEQEISNTDVEKLEKDLTLCEMQNDGYINMLKQVTMVEFKEYCLFKANEKSKTTYTVNFYKLINYGGSWISDGTTTIHGYKEIFNTESYEEACAEFERRKEEITKENKLGVTLGTWIDDVETDQINYNSEDVWISKNEYREEIKENNKYIAMKTLLRDLKIPSNNYYLFMSGDDGKLSEEKLKKIILAITSRPIGKIN